MNDYVHSLTKLKLKNWTLPCQERFKFGAGDLAVCKKAHIMPVLIHGACEVMRVSVVPGKIDPVDRQRHAESITSPI